MDREKISGSWFFLYLWNFRYFSFKNDFGPKNIFLSNREALKTQNIFKFRWLIMTSQHFYEIQFLSDINFIWRSFRNTHNFSKWTTQFVWISSTISNFSYFKRISRGPNSENRCFWQKIFWHIFSVTDIYHITKNKDFLRPSLSKLPDSYRKCLLSKKNQSERKSS